MSAGISDQRMKGQGNQGMFGPSFGQQSSYNHFPNNGENYNKNAWDSQQVNGASRRGYDDYNRGYDKQRSYGNDGIKSLEYGVQGIGLDGGNQRDSYTAKANSQSNTASSAQPKKTTWASIASQPVKSSQTRISSTLKKKPGMPSHIKVPPPPMIPGKHNMDIGLDSEKNGALVPPPVPSPPPVIDEPSPFQFPTKNQHNNSNNNSTNNNSEQFPAPSSNRNDYRDERGGQMNRDRDDRSDRGPMNRDRGDRGEGGWHRRDNGYPQNRGYQPRSNYGPPNHDRQMNYQDNRNYQPRPHYRSSPPQNQYYGPNRNENAQEQPPPPPAPKSDTDAPKPPTKSEEIPPPAVEKILDKNNYNPPELETEHLDKARFFVIKSYSEDDIHRSIKYEIWCSTEHGNKRLDQAFRDAEAENGYIYLLFSVNGSGHFCGVAQMTSAVDYNSVSSVWHQDKWKGKFSLRWIYVKDVPNSQLRHIRLENNENKSVTNSRDTQEVPNAKGQQVLQIIHTFVHSTSIFDDMEFYEQRQNEEDTKRVDIPPPQHDNDGPPKRGFHRNDGNYRDGGGFDGGYRPPNRNYDSRDQGNNRGYQNSYDNRRDFSRNFDRPPNRDYNRREGGNGSGGGGGFMSRDRGDNNRFDFRDRMDRNDDHHQGGFKRNYSNNYSNNFGNRGSNGPNSSYRNDRNDRNDRQDRNERIERSDRIERRDPDDDDRIERN